MSAHPIRFLTPEQYLEIERSAERRSEYYRGQMYAMAGGTHRHGVVIMNVGSELRLALKETPCQVSTTEVRVLTSPDGLYTYPDVMVVRSPRYTDETRETVTNPVVIVEVLSDSTEAYDRGKTFEMYAQIASLREYLLVAQKQPRVERFKRQPNGAWEYRDFAGLDAVCEVESLGCSIALREIYHKVAFDDPSLHGSVR